MAETIEYLDIPPMPKDIEVAIIDHTLHLIDIEGYVTSPSKIDAVVGHYKNIAARKTFFNFELPDSNLNLRLKEFIQEHFGPGRAAVVVIFNNTGTEPATFPAHNDSNREVALNYLLAYGGDNVTTSLYNGPPVDRINNKFYTLDKLQLIYQRRIEASRWHTFNAQCIHSVENILTTRIVFAVFDHRM